MNSESGPKAAPTNAPKTVRRSPDTERLLLRIPLARWLTPGMMEGFEERVVARLDQHGPDVDLTRTPTEILAEVEERALEIAALLLLLAYHDDTGLMETHVHDLVVIVSAAQRAAVAASHLRDGRGGDAR